MAISAVIFDLDCTLTCRRSTIAAAARKIASLYPDYLDGDCADVLIDALQTADQFGYRDRTAFFEDVFAAKCWKRRPEMQELLDFWRNGFADCNVLHEQALPVLAELRSRGLKLGLITNGHSVTQNGKIRKLGIAGEFDHVIVSGDFGIDKPDARIFHHACNSLGVTPATAAYVGDHPRNDVMGAEQAGLTAIWIRTGGPWPVDAPGPTRQIEQLADLPALLDAGV